METKMKVCAKCGKPKPSDKKYFYADKKQKDGLHAWCKVCHNESCKKKSAQGKTKKSTPKKIQNPRQGTQTKGVTSQVLTIDFSNHENLLTDLVDYAEKQFRTPEKQLLWWLSNRDYSLEADN